MALKLEDIKAQIRSHSIFFDHLVDLIPARFYVPVPDGKERPWYHGLSKAAKASAKKESRENIKKARRARFEPPEKISTTLDVLKKTINDEKILLGASEEEKHISEDNSGGDGKAEVENPGHATSGERSITYEELRQRLHRRIEELRGNRNTRTLDKPKEDQMQRRKGGYAPQLKENRDEEEVGKKTHDGDDDKKKSKAEMAKVEDISFGKVKLGGIDEKGSKKRKLSKRQELDKAKKLVDAKKDPDKGELIAQKHSWRAAMSRAVGEKVHDNPKVLQQSLKKEQKRHQKHAEKWKERIDSQSKVREEKQRTRNENIRERAQQKKKRRIEKREKKLMRPGFEGRKDGYINE